MPKNITIKVPDDVALWARRKAAEENTSVSRLVSQTLERQMRLTDEYWQAYERWKKIPFQSLKAAGKPWSREEVHERRH